MVRNVAGKTLFISGASRGVGRAVALRAAQDGANIIIAAKTADPHPKLPGTIYTVAEEVESLGGQALPTVTDIRDEESVEAAVHAGVQRFGGIDVLVNNASAINLAGTLDLPMKRFDLMHQINTRGTFLCSQKALPYLLKADNPHVINMSPPLNMEGRWFKDHVAYTMAKYGMSMCVLGMAEEFRDQGVAFNALWPRTLLKTAAVDNLLGGPEMSRFGRQPDIMADAAHAIMTRDSRSCTGNFFVDDDVLREEGVTDFSGYRVDTSLDESQLQQDFFLD